MSLGIKHNHDIFSEFYFVDTKYASVSKELMQKVIGIHRCTLLPVPGPLTLEQMLPKILEPGSPTKRAVLAPHDWKLYASYAQVSQDDPLWLSARGRPGLITASTLADFCLLHSDHCASQLHVPSFMSRAPGPSKCWGDHLARLHCPGLPSAPLDALMGAIFTTNGKEHENNANMHFFCRHPNLRYRDQGVTYVSPDILKRAGLTNLLTGQPILELPFLLGASPDGLFEVIKPTGDPELDAGGCVEWKAAKNVKLSFSRKTPFRGLAATHDNSAQPYNAIKSYYVPQSQDQLLACEKKLAFWGCWTLTGGMRVWKIRKSTEYLNLMLTVLIHLYETFVLNDLVVPDDYFCSFDTPAEARNIHRRLVDLTADIINMKRPDIAELYKEYPASDTESVVAEALLGDPRASVTSAIRPNITRFPDLPYWLPAYAAIGMFVVALTPVPPLWQQTPYKVNQRLVNLSMLFKHVPELGFLGPLMDAIRAGCPGVDNVAGYEEHENVKMMRTDRMERLVVLALTTMMNPTGERPGELRDLAKMSNAVPRGIDRVFGLAPCIKMYQAISGVTNPGVEIEIGLKYYRKITPNIIKEKMDSQQQQEEEEAPKAFPVFNVDTLHSRIFSDQGETRDILGSPVQDVVTLTGKLKRSAELQEIFDVDDSDDDDDNKSEGVINILHNDDSRTEVHRLMNRPKKSMLSPVIQSTQLPFPEREKGAPQEDGYVRHWEVRMMWDTGSSDQLLRMFIQKATVDVAASSEQQLDAALKIVDNMAEKLKESLREHYTPDQIEPVLKCRIEFTRSPDQKKESNPVQ